MGSVGTVINFCTNESRFIGPCLSQALLFSKQVIVPVASHFFDGTPENWDLLEKIYEAFPECLFVEYPFIPHRISQAIFKTVKPTAFWHSMSRLIGASLLDKTIEWVFFLDADEIGEGIRVKEWLDYNEIRCSLHFANYWYFRESCYRAEPLEDSIVLAKRGALTSDVLLNERERDAIAFDRRMVLGLDGKPLFHHFSWVRTEKEMLQKVKSWSHRHDRNWKEAIHKEFSGPFQGRDFVHGYQFHTVPPPFQVSAEPFFEPKGKKNVLRLSESEVERYAKMKKIPLRDLLLNFLS